MGLFIVTEYSVSLIRARKGAPPVPQFAIGLRGTSREGPVGDALIYFADSFLDNVGYIARRSGAAAAETGDQLVGLLPLGDFNYWYDFLRNENPISIRYVEGSSGPDQNRQPLDQISVGTLQEPVGQGLSDPGW